MEDHVITFLVGAIRRNRIIIGTRVVFLAFQLVTTHDAASQSMAASEGLPLMDRQPAFAFSSRQATLARTADVYVLGDLGQ
jgi:hypothetical protein